MKMQRRLSPDTLEKIDHVIDRLKEDNLTMPIIVEGLHDVSALREVGLSGEILHLNIGKSMLDFAIFIAERYDDVILLTDFDRKGEELMMRLGTLLKNEGVACHTEYWHLLRSLLGSEISEIEELVGILK